MMKNWIFTLICAVALVAVIGAAAPAYAESVGVFDNGSYVDTSGTPAYSESDTVQASLSSLGHTVNTFTGFAAGDWTTAGGANDVILIPELEAGDLNAAMSAAAKTALGAYVSGGGHVIVMGHGSRDISLLNDVFGFSLVGTGSVGTTSLDAAEAAGTAFAGGPATIPYHSYTPGVSRASLPVGALDLYHDATENSVFSVGYGAGTVTRLGWDWFNAAPLGTKDGGWLSVLDSAVGHGSPVPEPGSIALLGLGLAGLAFGARRRRKLSA